MNRNIEDVLNQLANSKFRSSFHLSKELKNYIGEKGMDTIRSHAYDFVRTRLAGYPVIHDGKQTPMRGHPVFVAQHATATCCRNCLFKWHHISKNRALTQKEQDFIVTLIMTWILKDYDGN